jgi:hypothetical protein
VVQPGQDWDGDNGTGALDRPTVASENSVHLTRGQPLCLSAQGSRWDLLGLHYLNVLPPNGGGRLTQSECQLGQL